MATVNFHDGADEFRIEIVGNFAGASVHEVETRWHLALAERSRRRVTVDISRLAGYENNGRKLLRSMYQHGTNISAANPESLMFLGEITAPPRHGPIPSLVREPAHGHTESHAREQTPKTRAATAGK